MYVFSLRSVISSDASLIVRLTTKLRIPGEENGASVSARSRVSGKLEGTDLLVDHQGSPSSESE